MERVKEAAKLLDLERVPRAQAQGALRWPAPARRHGPRDRPPAAGVLHGRAAVEPRRQAPGLDPHADRRAAAAARRHHRLRHPRPGRGDDDGRPGRGAQGRHPAAGRHPAEPLRRARQPVRRRLHRLAGDEPAAAPTTSTGTPSSATSRSRSRASAASKASGDITVGVRPENWRIVDEGEGIPVKVTVVEELGADGFIYGTSGAEGTPDSVTIRIDGRRSHQKGETIYVTTDPDERARVRHRVRPAAVGRQPAGRSPMQRLTALDAQFLNVESPTTVGHVGSLIVLDPPDRPRRSVGPGHRPGRLRAPAAPRQTAPAASGRGAAGARSSLLGRRPALRHRVPPARARAALARHRRAARRAGRPHPRPPARPQPPAVGGLRHHRSRGRPLRVLLQDPPRGDRRGHRRRRSSRRSWT